MPRVPVLDNDFVVLRPLHLDDSAALLDLIDEEMWFGMTVPTPRNVGEMAEYVESLLTDPSRLGFAVVDNAGSVVGFTSLYELVVSQQRVEIGSTFYGRHVWGTAVNPACKLLLFEYSFDQLGLHRVALRCDARNTRSVAAIEKLGAVYEGTLRGHRIAADGSRGDTSYFSVLAAEWPNVRAGLEARLSRGW